jgi:hypothetical protein
MVRPPRPPFPSPHLLPFLPLLVLPLLAGCERGFPTPEDRGTVSEETFVEAMAALRGRALVPDEFDLAEEERERILDTVGVAWEELVTFADVHGVDVPYMYEVWARVDSAIVARSLEGEQDPDDPGAPNGAATGDAPPAPR